MSVDSLATVQIDLSQMQQRHFKALGEVVLEVRNLWKSFGHGDVIA